MRKDYRIFARLKFNIKRIIMNHYETVFILNPVLSDDQVKETVQKFYDYLVSKGAEMISKEDWGLKKWPIQSKKRKPDFFIYLNTKCLVR